MEVFHAISRNNYMRKFIGSQMSLAMKAIGTRKLSNNTSNSNDEIKVDLDSDSGIALVKWNRKPVNSYNLNFMENNLEIFQSLQSNPSCRGTVLTSELQSVFSAGLDLKEFINSDRELMEKRTLALSNFSRGLFFSNKPLVVAINGHAPAGGCVIAMTADYRVMKSGVGTIGLNEAALGVILPKWVSLWYAKLLGHRRAELAVLKGTLFSAEDALSIGLVDEVSTGDTEDLLRRAKEQAVKLATTSSTVFGILKVDLRESMMKAFDADRANLETNVNHMMAARDMVQQYMNNLRKTKSTR